MPELRIPGTVSEAGDRERRGREHLKVGRCLYELREMLDHLNIPLNRSTDLLRPVRFEGHPHL